MTGYTQRVIKLDFPGLTADDAADPVWVTIRNPQLMSPSELTPKGGGGVTADGTPEDPEAAEDSMYKMFARLVVGSRVYDACQDVQLDEQGNDSTEQVRLPQGRLDAAQCRKLPLVIINAIGDKVKAATNPN